MTTKKCSKCEEVKPLTDYYNYKRSKDGKQAYCGDCSRQYYHKNKDAINKKRKQYHKANKEVAAERCKQYYQANKVHLKEKQKQYLEANKETITERRKQYYHANKDAIVERRNCYYQENKEAIIEKRKQYYQANKSALVSAMVKYARERRGNDPLFRLTHNIRSLITKSLTKGGYSKKSKTHEILGCSYEEYHQHIENQFVGDMSWSRFDEIHIDHRLPVSAANTEAELLALNHHRNLQPMWAKDNIVKADNYCPDELAAYFAKYL